MLNLWLLPLYRCANNFVSIYGSNVIEARFQNDNICFFSPTFDSKNGKYTVRAKAYNHDGYHSAAIFVDDFDKPKYTSDESLIPKTLTIKTGYFVEYKFSPLMKYEKFSIFYREKRNQK